MVMEKHNYNTLTYNFRDKIQSLYNTNLEDLHHKMEIFDANTDQSSPFHKTYYDGISKTGFYEVYKSFISNIIQPLFNEKILYQRIPTFRVHMIGNLGVGEYHKDSMYAHSPDEVNIFLPVTKAFNNNTIWVQEENDESTFHPMNCEYGEFYMWDGANLLHGNKLNDTDSARVSFDFRILPYSKYNEKNSKSSITNNTKMVIGEYWSEL
jgi:hypothetical protein